MSDPRVDVLSHECVFLMGFSLDLISVVESAIELSIRSDRNSKNDKASGEYLEGITIELREVIIFY